MILNYIFLKFKKKIIFIYKKFLNLVNFNKISIKSTNKLDTKQKIQKIEKQTQTELTFENLDNLIKLEDNIKIINSNPEDYKWVIL